MQEKSEIGLRQRSATLITMKSISGDKFFFMNFIGHMNWIVKK